MRNKMWKRVIAAAMTGVMLAGMTTGCGSGSSKKGDDSNITIFLMKDDYEMYTSYSDNPIVQYLNEKFDVTLEFQQPAQGSDSNQFNLMLGTGDFTDVMEISSSGSVTTQKMYEDEVIYDLAPYLEEHMPNYVKFLEEHETYKNAYYTDDGRLYTIPMHLTDMDDYTEMWGGFVYRRDILETMTNGKVKFPSGEEEPTTVDDWTYMLELMKKYYEQEGYKDYACLIIPSSGYVATGELTNGFGTYTSYYMEGDEVVYGPTTEKYYNYLKQMNEWYKAGYIYQDFASRTGDAFYSPNPSLVNSGAVGVWYGTTGQIGDALQDVGVAGADVRACAPPIDAKNGQDGSGSAINMLYGNAVSMDTAGYVVTTECSEEKLIKFLEVCDYLFTDEGAMLASYGLDKEHGAAENEVYKKLGLEDGAWWFDEDGNFQSNPISKGTDHSYYNAMTGYRLPGKRIFEYKLQEMEPEVVEAAKTWGKYGFDSTYPNGVQKTTAESKELGDLAAQYGTELDTMTVKFIMGTEPLTKESFEEFCGTLETLGTTRGTEIKQEQYDRYVKGEVVEE